MSDRYTIVTMAFVAGIMFNAIMQCAATGQ
jgi:hypothetical protein